MGTCRAIEHESLLQRGCHHAFLVQLPARFCDDAHAIARFFAVAEIVEHGPDIIVVHSNPFLAALRQVDRTIPTVFVQVADPVSSGFVGSFARPGGNVTGFTNFEAEIGGKWLELIKEIATRVTRTLVLLHRETAANVALLRAAEAAAPARASRRADRVSARGYRVELRSDRRIGRATSPAVHLSVPILDGHKTAA
jgi:hypothetical protein